jgi:hypothetical protein
MAGPPRPCQEPCLFITNGKHASCDQVGAFRRQRKTPKNLPKPATSVPIRGASHAQAPTATRVCGRGPPRARPPGIGMSPCQSAIAAWGSSLPALTRLAASAEAGRGSPRRASWALRGRPKEETLEVLEARREFGRFLGERPETRTAGSGCSRRWASTRRRGLLAADRQAPRVGLEPTTNRLRLPPCFHGERTISSPQRGAGRSRLAYWTGSSPASLCTFPATDCPSPGLAQDCRHPFVLRVP